MISNTQMIKRVYSPSQAQHQSSQSRHPVDYKRVDKRGLLGCYKASLLLEIKVQVQIKCRSNMRTGGPWAVQDPVKMRLQPTQVHYRTINLYLESTEALHKRGNMATPTTITTLGTMMAEEAMLAGNQKQPTINTKMP